MTRYALPARRKSAEYGINCAGKTARQPTRSDFDKCGLLIGTNRSNLQNMYRICGGDVGGRKRLLLDYTDHPGDVTDPCDFETIWRDRGLLS